MESEMAKILKNYNNKKQFLNTTKKKDKLFKLITLLLSMDAKAPANCKCAPCNCQPSCKCGVTGGCKCESPCSCNPCKCAVSDKCACDGCKCADCKCDGKA